jgi:60 kDa SS-A/Ro ribonucleoprotein
MPQPQLYGTATQREPLPGQVANSAGGFSYPVDDWTRLERFLILGAEGGSYYAGARKLTTESMSALFRCAGTDAARTIQCIVDVSTQGRAPKNDYAIFALGALLRLPEAKPALKTLTSRAVPQVCRTSYHLFQLASFLFDLQPRAGFGPAKLKAFRHWYEQLSAADFAFQAIKYQQRNGWDHKRLLRLSHPNPTNQVWHDVAHWVLKGWPGIGTEPHPIPELCRIWAFERAHQLKDQPDALAALITKYRLPWECVPSEALNQPTVWEALLPQLPLTALIRNLPKLTVLGLVAPLSTHTYDVVVRLGDEAQLHKARIHPLQVLTAQRAYLSGASKSGLTWTPVPAIAEALEQAFYLSFKNVPRTGKRRLVALDLSASMTWHQIAGSPFTPREAAAALAMITLRQEEQVYVMGFGDRFMPLALHRQLSLQQVVDLIDVQQAGGTDCSLPMRWAMDRRVPVDVFEVYTDSETWAGPVHPSQALREYRQRSGIAAKLITVGMLSNGFSIADPEDAGMMDVVGFDTATPAIMNSFIADFKGRGVHAGDDAEDAEQAGD